MTEIFDKIKEEFSEFFEQFDEIMFQAELDTPKYYRGLIIMEQNVYKLRRLLEKLENNVDHIITYGLFNMCQEMEIGCCQSGCRGRVSALDADLYWQEWDDKIIEALQNLQQIDQPLLPLVDAVIRERLEAYLAKTAPYESVQKLRHRTNIAS